MLISVHVEEDYYGMKVNSYNYHFLNAERTIKLWNSQTPLRQYLSVFDVVTMQIILLIIKSVTK